MLILLVNGFEESPRGEHEYAIFLQLLQNILQELEVRDYSILERRINRLGDIVVDWEFDSLNEQSRKNCRHFDKIDMVFISGDMRICPWDPLASQVVTLINMCKHMKKATFCSGFGAFSAIYTFATKGARFHILNGPDGGEIEELPTFPRYSVGTGAYPSGWLDNETGDLYTYNPLKRIWIPVCNLGIYRIASSGPPTKNRQTPLLKRYAHEDHLLNQQQKQVEPLDSDTTIARVRNVHVQHAYVRHFQEQNFVMKSYLDWYIKSDTSLPAGESLFVIADGNKGAVLLAKDRMLIMSSKIDKSLSYASCKLVMKNYLQDMMPQIQSSVGGKVECSLLDFLFGADGVSGGTYDSMAARKPMSSPLSHIPVPTHIQPPAGPVKVDPPAIGMFLYTPKQDNVDFLALTSSRRCSTVGRKPHFQVQNPLSARQKRLEILSKKVGIGVAIRTPRERPHRDGSIHSSRETKTATAAGNASSSADGTAHSDVISQALALSQESNPYEIEENKPAFVKEMLSGVSMNTNSVSLRRTRRTVTPQEENLRIRAELEKQKKEAYEQEQRELGGYDLQKVIKPFGQQQLPVPGEPTSQSAKLKATQLLLQQQQQQRQQQQQQQANDLEPLEENVPYEQYSGLEYVPEEGSSVPDRPPGQFSTTTPTGSATAVGGDGNGDGGGVNMRSSYDRPRSTRSDVAVIGRNDGGDDDNESYLESDVASTIASLPPSTAQSMKLNEEEIATLATGSTVADSSVPQEENIQMLAEPGVASLGASDYAALGIYEDDSSNDRAGDISEQEAIYAATAGTNTHAPIKIPIRNVVEDYVWNARTGAISSKMSLDAYDAHSLSAGIALGSASSTASNSLGGTPLLASPRAATITNTTTTTNATNVEPGRTSTTNAPLTAPAALEKQAVQLQHDNVSMPPVPLTAEGASGQGTTTMATATVATVLQVPGGQVDGEEEQYVPFQRDKNPVVFLRTANTVTTGSAGNETSTTTGTDTSNASSHPMVPHKPSTSAPRSSSSSGSMSSSINNKNKSLSSNGVAGGRVLTPSSNRPVSHTMERVEEDDSSSSDEDESHRNYHREEAKMHQQNSDIASHSRRSGTCSLITGESSSLTGPAANGAGLKSNNSQQQQLPPASVDGMDSTSVETGHSVAVRVLVSIPPIENWDLVRRNSTAGRQFTERTPASHPPLLDQQAMLFSQTARDMEYYDSSSNIRSVQGAATGATAGGGVIGGVSSLTMAVAGEVGMDLGDGISGSHSDHKTASMASAVAANGGGGGAGDVVPNFMRPTQSKVQALHEAKVEAMQTALAQMKQRGISSLGAGNTSLGGGSSDSLSSFAYNRYSMINNNNNNNKIKDPHNIHNNRLMEPTESSVMRSHLTSLMLPAKPSPAPPPTPRTPAAIASALEELYIPVQRPAGPIHRRKVKGKLYKEYHGVEESDDDEDEDDEIAEGGGGSRAPAAAAAAGTLSASIRSEGELHPGVSTHGGRVLTIADSMAHDGSSFHTGVPISHSKSHHLPASSHQENSNNLSEEELYAATATVKEMESSYSMYQQYHDPATPRVILPTNPAVHRPYSSYKRITQQLADRKALGMTSGPMSRGTPTTATVFGSDNNNHHNPAAAAGETTTTTTMMTQKPSTAASRFETPIGHSNLNTLRATNGRTSSRGVAYQGAYTQEFHNPDDARRKEEMHAKKKHLAGPFRTHFGPAASTMQVRQEGLVRGQGPYPMDPPPSVEAPAYMWMTLQRPKQPPLAGSWK